MHWLRDEQIILLKSLMYHIWHSKLNTMYRYNQVNLSCFSLLSVYLKILLNNNTSYVFTLYKSAKLSQQKDTCTTNWSYCNHHGRHFCTRKLTHPCDGCILSIVNTETGSKLQKQLCTHWSVTMNACHKPDLGLRRLLDFRVVGDLQSPDSSELHTLTKTS